MSHSAEFSLLRSLWERRASSSPKSASSSEGVALLETRDPTPGSVTFRVRLFAFNRVADFPRPDRVDLLLTLVLFPAVDMPALLGTGDSVRTGIGNRPHALILLRERPSARVLLPTPVPLPTSSDPDAISTARKLSAHTLEYPPAPA